MISNLVFNNLRCNSLKTMYAQTQYVPMYIPDTVNTGHFKKIAAITLEDKINRGRLIMLLHYADYIYDKCDDKQELQEYCINFFCKQHRDKLLPTNSCVLL